MKRLKELFKKQMSFTVVGTVLGLLAVVLVTFFLTKECSNTNSISSEKNSYREVKIGENVIKNLEAQGIQFTDFDIEEENPNDYETIYKGEISYQWEYPQRTKSGKIKTYYVLEIPVKMFPDRTKYINVPKDIALKEWENNLAVGKEIYYKRLDKSKVSEEERDIIPNYYFSVFVEKTETTKK